MLNITSFPSLLLPMSKKTKTWRKKCLDFADSTLRYNHSGVRNSLLHLKVNYDLMNGKLHMDDLQLVINPEGLKAGFIPNKILHYPIINAKLDVLTGEEIRRIFDYRVVVTNPTAVSEIENAKKLAIFESLLKAMYDTSQTEDQFNRQLEDIENYFQYLYLDFRETRANYLLNHYNKEYNFPLIFNKGFSDAKIVGEEIYQCDIVGGEPVLERLNPMKVRIFRSGTSNKIEDADMIILEDYWSPGKVYDYFYDSLTDKDRKFLEAYPDHFTRGSVDAMDNIDETLGFVHSSLLTDDLPNSTLFFDPVGNYGSGVGTTLAPYDMNGNIRVVRVYWKSRRKIKKIKFYNQNGEEDFTFMSESYTPNEYRGEEEESFWVNEAWEGTKIGKDIYVNIRPRIVQYNTIDNPSRCHFGIIGTIYNTNDDKPFSMVDRMKPYSYLYDIIHDRLNKLMARNWGKMIRMDLAKKPSGWNTEKWLYYAKTMGLFVENSFNEGKKGPATGILAGALNNNAQGVIDADLGNGIQLYINILEFIKMEMADVAGISKQREGQIANRETVGGVERATLQSSHITEWLFATHDDLKRRVLTAFMETAKAALRGRIKKFQYILPDYSLVMVEIDGDEFAECSYGIVIDNSNNIQELLQKLEVLAQAALQNQTLNFSTIMKLYSTASLAEKQRYVETDERKIKLERELQLQQALLQQQQTLLALMLTAQEERQFKDSINQRDNETKLMVAEINSLAELTMLLLKNNLNLDGTPITGDDGVEEPENYSPEAKAKLLESMRLFDKRLQLDREKLLFLKEKAKTDAELKRAQLKNKTKS